MNPEKWKFYDVNIDAIKPELGDIEFAGGLTREEFIEKESDFNQFLAYQARKDKKPEAGQYDVKYNAVEPEPKAPDFDKYLEREGPAPVSSYSFLSFLFHMDFLNKKSPSKSILG